MEKTYSISEVIEVMNFGEVAVKVNEERYRNGIDIGQSIFFDEKDGGLLKTMEGYEVTFCKVIGNQKKDRFVIMPRSAYEQLKG